MQALQGPASCIRPDTFLPPPGRASAAPDSEPGQEAFVIGMTGKLTRRALLAQIGTVAGSAVMYQAMTSLGIAQ